MPKKKYLTKKMLSSTQQAENDVVFNNSKAASEIMAKKFGRKTAHMQRNFEKYFECCKKLGITDSASKHNINKQLSNFFFDLSPEIDRSVLGFADGESISLRGNITGKYRDNTINHELSHHLTFSPWTIEKLNFTPWEKKNYNLQNGKMITQELGFASRGAAYFPSKIKSTVSKFNIKDLSNFIYDNYDGINYFPDWVREFENKSPDESNVLCLLDSIKAIKSTLKSEYKARKKEIDKYLSEISQIVYVEDEENFKKMEESNEEAEKPNDESSILAVLSLYKEELSKLNPDEEISDEKLSEIEDLIEEEVQRLDAMNSPANLDKDNMQTAVGGGAQNFTSVDFEDYPYLLKLTMIDSLSNEELFELLIESFLQDIYERKESATLAVNGDLIIKIIPGKEKFTVYQHQNSERPYVNTQPHWYGINEGATELLAEFAKSHIENKPIITSGSYRAQTAEARMLYALAGNALFNGYFNNDYSMLARKLNVNKEDIEKLFDLVNEEYSLTFERFEAESENYQFDKDANYAMRKLEKFTRKKQMLSKNYGYDFFNVESIDKKIDEQSKKLGRINSQLNNYYDPVETKIYINDLLALRDETQTRLDTACNKKEETLANSNFKPEYVTLIDNEIKDLDNYILAIDQEIADMYTSLDTSEKLDKLTAKRDEIGDSMEKLIDEKEGLIAKQKANPDYIKFFNNTTSALKEVISDSQFDIRMASEEKIQQMLDEMLKINNIFKKSCFEMLKYKICDEIIENEELFSQPKAIYNSVLNSFADYAKVIHFYYIVSKDSKKVQPNEECWTNFKNEFVATFNKLQEHGFNIKCPSNDVVEKFIEKCKQINRDNFLLYDFKDGEIDVLGNRFKNVNLRLQRSDEEKKTFNKFEYERKKHSFPTVRSAYDDLEA